MCKSRYLKAKENSKLELELLRNLQNEFEHSINTHGFVTKGNMKLLKRINKLWETRMKETIREEKISYKFYIQSLLVDDGGATYE